MAEQADGTSVHGKKILLGVCGGIAAYKVAELIRLFKKAGAEVQVLMTEDAARFVTPLTLATLSENEVLSEIFPEHAEGSWTKHIHLGLWADLFVVAPATAQTMAKLALGFSDSMLTATALAARCPLLLCPAMDHDMYRHPATQRNLERLRNFGYRVMEAAYGPLASGLTGYGRLPEPAAIFSHVAEHFTAEARAAGSDAPSRQSLRGQRVLVTAGPTREALDPVRYLSNHSSGRMGYALAAAARRRGANVTLVSGPTALAAPEGVTRVDVESADEMHRAVQAWKDADLIIMAAAVADYAPAERAPSKIKKTANEYFLRLQRTPDVLASLGRDRRPGQILVGFALETDDPLGNARKKLEGKNLDWIVVNRAGEPGAGFGTTTNRVTLLSRQGDEHALPLMSKPEVAEAILNHVCAAPAAGAAPPKTAEGEERR